MRTLHVVAVLFWLLGLMVSRSHVQSFLCRPPPLVVVVCSPLASARSAGPSSSTLMLRTAAEMTSSSRCCFNNDNDNDDTPPFVVTSETTTTSRDVSSILSSSTTTTTSRRSLLLSTTSFIMTSYSVAATTVEAADDDTVSTTISTTADDDDDASSARPKQTRRSTLDAQVTDKIFIDIKGLTGGVSSQDQSSSPRRIVIGLFGKDAPEAVRMLKLLVDSSSRGLRTPCRPRDIRSLQKEQLEANKVYNSCMENQDRGVTYDYGTTTIWRIVHNFRIDVGAVSGKYIARQFPTWQGTNDLLHDRPGVVSVRKGNDSGFGFTIYPGGNGDMSSLSYLDETQLVVGRVLEGMDVVNALNNVPVVTSAKLPSSLSDLNPAPTRACRYGGSQLYCNEYKPLQKLSLSSTGVL